MCTCMPLCFQRNLVTFAKARPAQMIFITTCITICGAHAGMENQYRKSIDSDTLHTESEMYDITG